MSSAKLVALLAATLLFVSGTVTGAKPNPTTAVPKDVAGAPVDSLGTVIGTIGYRTNRSSRVDRVAFAFRKIGSTVSDNDLGYVSLVRSRSLGKGKPGTISEGKYNYGAFKLELPEGQYEIIRVVGVYNAGSCIAGNSAGFQTDGTIRYSNPEDFSVPFEVKRGKVLYLGSFLAFGTIDMGNLCFIPMPVPNTVYLSYADKWQRDASVFTGELAVDTASVEHASLAVNENTAYYLIAEDHLDEPLSTKLSDLDQWSHQAKIARYRATHPETPPTESPSAQPTEPQVSH